MEEDTISLTFDSTREWAWSEAIHRAGAKYYERTMGKTPLITGGLPDPNASKCPSIARGGGGGGGGGGVGGAIH